MDLPPFILDVPDFPKPGILFRDLSPLLADAAAFAAAIRALAVAVADLPVDVVAGIEARGFIFGAALVLVELATLGGRGRLAPSLPVRGVLAC